MFLALFCLSRNFSLFLDYILSFFFFLGDIIIAHITVLISAIKSYYEPIITIPARLKETHFKNFIRKNMLTLYET